VLVNSGGSNLGSERKAIGRLRKDEVKFSGLSDTLKRTVEDGTILKQYEKKKLAKIRGTLLRLILGRCCLLIRTVF